MRWPIRNQILVPFIAIQIVTVLVVALSSAWMAVRQVDEEVGLRLNGVMTTLESASYPLTANILDQLHQLSGAHFVVYDRDGTIAGSTLSEFRTPSSRLMELQADLSKHKPIGDRTILTISAEQYIAGSVMQRSNTGPKTILVLYPESQLAQARWQAVFPPVLLGAVLLLLTILASFWISKRIAHRIQKVQQYVSRIADGDFAQMPVTKTRDELKDLSESVNRMAVVLDQSMKQLQENERAAMLTQLVGGLAHQLRNSLTGARVSIQLHQRHCPERHDEAIEVAVQQLTLTEEQIKALLKLSKGESGLVRPGDLGTILDEALSLVRPLCAHQKIELTYEREGWHCSVADSDAMRGSLLNLIINGIEATGANGHITVFSQEESDQIIIDIIDDGPGISEDLMEQIFIPFITTKPEGAGLGLALARQAAEECGGTLTILKSDATTLRLTIPKQRDLRYVDTERNPSPTFQANNKLKEATAE